MGIKKAISFFLFCMLSVAAKAQLPDCTGSGMIYITTFGGQIYNFDPSQPISATNPSLNTIPGASIDLAVSDNLNATAPSPTFYVGTPYYNGITWVTPMPNYSFTSPNKGAGGGFIYAIDPSETIWRYDGASNADSITTLQGTYAADIVADCSGNFYVLKITNPLKFYKYNQVGTLLSTWTVTGTLGAGPIGLAMINNIVYAGDNVMYKGVISGSTIHFSLIGNLGINASDYASCPCIPCHGAVSIRATPDTLCGNGPLQLFADTFAVSTLATYSWTGPLGFSNTTLSAVISNATVANAGIYTITVTDTGSCTYKSYIKVDSPFVLSSTYNGPTCVGDSIQLHASGVPAAYYHWSGPNNFSSSWADTVIFPVTLADSGDYYVSATQNGCVTPDTLKVKIKPLPALSLSANSVSLCTGDTLKLVVTDSMSGISHSWSGPASFNTLRKDTALANIQLVNAGTYRLIATLNGCKDTTTENVIINPVLGPPTISITANPGDTVCAGNTVTFTASSTIAGSNPLYQWTKNNINISGANSNSYTTGSVVTGDLIRCKLVSNAICQPANTATSDSVLIYLIAIPPVSVSLTYYPLSYVAGDTVSFTGHVPLGSSGLSYAWTKNGIIIPGVHTITYTSTTVSPGDSICLLTYSSVPCTSPNPSSTCVELTTGINTPAFEEIKVYPNPANEILYVSASGPINIVISSIEGKTILEQKNTRKVDIGFLPDGVYMLEIYTPGHILLKKEKLVKIKR